MIQLDDFLRLRRLAAKYQSGTDEAKGRLKEVMSRLRKDCGVKTLDEAERFLRKVKKERDKAAAKYNKELAAFKKKWSDKLENDDGP